MKRKVTLMKKIAALFLTLMMVFALSFAIAQETPMIAIEDLYDGVWVQFEDGFELYLPADWYEMELSEEWYAQGIFYAAGTEDFSQSVTLAWQPLEAECTLEEAQVEFEGEYPGATIVEANGVQMLLFVDMESNLLNFIALDGTEPGYYLFAFSPVDDEDFQLLAALIASTIRNIE